MVSCKQDLSVTTPQKVNYSGKRFEGKVSGSFFVENMQLLNIVITHYDN